MTTRTDFDRVVADWLAGTAGAGAPDYLDEALDRVSTVRQRPWWSSPERWLPVNVSARTASWAPAPRLGRILLIAAIVVALVGLAIFAAGSQHRVPPPFGPARDGILSFSTSGDIYAIDSIDGTPRSLIGGTSDDFGPSFSRDGKQLSFLRGSCESGGTVTLMVANADGTNVRPLVELPECPAGVDLTPDGSAIAVAGAIGGVSGIYFLKTDGSDAPHRLDSDAADVSWPTWRPPDGHELLYFSSDSNDLRLIGVRSDGSNPHLVKDFGWLGSGAQDQLAPSLSPDGRFLVYAAEDDDGLLHNHVLDLTTGAERTLSLGPPGYHELHGVLSPDGTKLLFHDIDAGVTTVQEMLAPLDGSALAIPIGPPYPIVDGSADLNQAFSPDGRTILISEGRDQVVRIVDATTGGAGRDAGWQTGDLPTWQRAAP